MKVGNVLTPTGKLQYSGYLSSPTLKWDPSPLLNSYRYKQWEFYAIYTSELIIGVGIADIAYAKNVFITIYETGKQGRTLEKIIPPWEKMMMSNHSTVGTSFYNNTSFLVFAHNVHDTLRNVVAQHGDIDINFEFRRKSNQESMVYLGPFNSDMSQFFYSHKEYNFLVDGYVKIGEKEHLIHHELGIMDWGRGVWPYNSGWVWGSGMGKVDGNLIGLNIGQLPKDRTAAEASDDCVFYNEKMIKLGVVNVDQDPVNKNIWKFRTVNSDPDSRFASVTGEFVMEKNFEKFFNVWVIKSELNQMFGEFTGKVTTIDDSFDFKVRGILEVHQSRW